jgi:hypothetical protein
MLDWLKNLASLSAEKRVLIESENKEISIFRQYELVGLLQVSLYYLARP